MSPPEFQSLSCPCLEWSACLCQILSFCLIKTDVSNFKFRSVYLKVQCRAEFILKRHALPKVFRNDSIQPTGAHIFTFGTSGKGAYSRPALITGHGAYFFFEKQPNVQNKILTFI